MTTETSPNENVQAVLDYIKDWTLKQPKLLWHDGDSMRIEIDMSMLAGDTKANIIEWHISQNWRLDHLNTPKETAEMEGIAYEVHNETG
jgi:hypothetical protein